MTANHGISRLKPRLLVLSVCAALLAQMALPALHAVKIGGPLHRVAAVWHGASSHAAADVRAAQPTSAHDAATCPVCQSLLLTSPVATPRVAAWAPRPGVARALAVAPLRARSAAAQIGHTPRAPPADAFHLA
jgi:hypothetical protein